MIARLRSDPIPLRKIRAGSRLSRRRSSACCNKAMQRNPDDRYQTTLEFADAFGAAATRDPTARHRTADCSASCSVADRDHAPTIHRVIRRAAPRVRASSGTGGNWPGRNARSRDRSPVSAGVRRPELRFHDRSTDTGNVIHGYARTRGPAYAARRHARARSARSHVNSVTCRRIARCHSRVRQNEVHIPFRAKWQALGVRVEVAYGGAVTDGLIVRTDSAGRWTYFGDNWPNRARHWIPSIDHPSDKATVTWRVIAPPAAPSSPTALIDR